MKDDWLHVSPIGDSFGLLNGFAFGGVAMDLFTNIVFEVAFTFLQKVTSNPREFVGPLLSHDQSKLLHRLFVDQHVSSSLSAGLYLS